MLKKLFGLSLSLILSLSYHANAQDIRISTKNNDLILRVGAGKLLYQPYLGKKLANESDINRLGYGHEAYISHGMKDYFSSAIRVVHTDHNPSLELCYKSHSQKQIDKNVTQTTITLKDTQYPIEVKLIYTSYAEQDIIKCHSEITHKEDGNIMLHNYASSMLHFDNKEYYLTSFSGDHAYEVNMSETKLDFGKKIIDTKLGTRANMFSAPFFIIGLDGKAQETSGEAILGTLAWTGNYSFIFDVDQNGELRIVSGINPESSEYSLEANKTFVTPEFIFSYSSCGVGQASRNFHDWALKYQVKHGDKSRLTLLNNWEATHFDFNEEKLSVIIKDASDMGVDMFLLDDGWFGNKYPRRNSTAGLGDWQETKTKLPNGIAKLVEISKENNVKFGLWVEPEMVNPKSELYHNHKDWVIRLPNRKEYYFRKQLVLDLSNPEVQDFVYKTVDDILTTNPEIAFLKWDCNSPITNIYSEYLGANQSHLYIDYVNGLYKVLDKLLEKHPEIQMMLCAGGGGRGDFKALEYFTEFWPSDNTGPLERIFIQWGFSYVFPAKTLCAHVTNWDKRSGIKFKTDVAMMGKLGYDIIYHDLSPADRAFCQRALITYKRISPTIQEGDLYRLHSPYNSDHASQMYVSKDKSKAILFAFNMTPRNRAIPPKVKLQGLDANKNYLIKEINVIKQAKNTTNKKQTQKEEDFIVSGSFLMNFGLDVFLANERSSKVFEITEQ
ncbi:MAG: alpha-galactosidase [Rikenellaceae bacterium]